jgi:hypothetical protein
LPDSRDRRLGRTINKARKTARFPNMRCRLMLKIPRRLEIVKLPKPTRLDKEEKSIPYPMICGRGTGHGDRASASPATPCAPTGTLRFEVVRSSSSGLKHLPRCRYAIQLAL